MEKCKTSGCCADGTGKKCENCQCQETASEPTARHHEIDDEPTPLTLTAPEGSPVKFDPDHLGRILSELP